MAHKIEKVEKRVIQLYITKLTTENQSSELVENIHIGIAAVVTNFYN